MPPDTKSSPGNWKEILLVICVAAALSIAFLNKPFHTRGEPREALVAQAMLASDNWLLGSGYGGAVPSKPPFMHWFISAFSIVAGEVNEWTARLPSALASVLFAFGWFRFLRRRTDSDTALLSTLLLLTSVEWFRAAIACRVDMILAVLMCGTLAGLYGWWERKLTGYPLWTMIAALGATLTKGPVAIALPGAIFALFLFKEGERPGRIIGKALAVFVPALVGALLWYVAAYIERGPEFFGRVYYENFARLTSTQEDSPHKHSVFYLLGTVPLGFLPWTLLLIPFVPSAIAFLARGPKRWREWFNAASPLTRLAFFATVVTFLLFSIPSGKRSVYLLPIYPFLAYGFASVLIRGRYHELLTTRVIVRLATGALSIGGLFVFFFSGVLANLGGGAALDGKNSGVFVQNILGGLSDGTAPRETMLLYLFVALCIVGALCTGGILKRVIDLPIYIATLLVVASGSLLMYGAHQLSGKELAFEANGVLPIVAPVHSFNNEFYGLSFYLGREITTLKEAPQPGSYVFLYSNDLPKFQQFIGDPRRAQTILTSQNSVDKPGRTVTLVRIRSI